MFFLAIHSPIKNWLLIHGLLAIVPLVLRIWKSLALSPKATKVYFWRKIPFAFDFVISLNEVKGLLLNDISSPLFRESFY